MIGLACSHARISRLNGLIVRDLYSSRACSDALGRIRSDIACEMPMTLMKSRRLFSSLPRRANILSSGNMRQSQLVQRRLFSAEASSSGSQATAANAASLSATGTSQDSQGQHEVASDPYESGKPPLFLPHPKEKLWSRENAFQTLANTYEREFINQQTLPREALTPRSMWSVVYGSGHAGVGKDLFFS